MKGVKQIVLVFCLLFGLSTSAQILKPAKWEYRLSEQDIRIGDIVEVVFNVKLDNTWHLYGNIQNYELGPLPAVFEFEPNASYALIGDVEPIGTLKKYDDVFEADVNYFEDTAEFRQKVKILSESLVIMGSYEYQVCTMVDGRCIMGDGEFELNAYTSN